MKKTWLIGVGVLTLAIGTAMAEGDAAAEPKASPKKEAGAPAAKPELKDITVTGVIESVALKEGKSGFGVKGDNGEVARLPRGKGTPDYAALVGVKVKVTGKGYEREKAGKKHYLLKSVTSVDKVPEAPAQPAAQ